MKFVFAKKKQPFALVSMADIAFLLLIFLVLTVTVGEQDSVSVPEFLYAGKTGFSQIVPVELMLNGDVQVNGRTIPGGGSPAGREALSDALNDLKRNFTGNGEPVIRFAADGTAPYEQVDYLLGALREADLTHVVLAAEPKEPERADGR